MTYLYDVLLQVVPTTFHSVEEFWSGQCDNDLSPIMCFNVSVIELCDEEADEDDTDSEEEYPVDDNSQPPVELRNIVSSCNQIFKQQSAIIILKTLILTHYYI